MPFSPRHLLSGTLLHPRPRTSVIPQTQHGPHTRHTLRAPFPQRDTEEADIEKERQQQLKGPAARAHELQELTEIYIGRGLTPELARQVAEQLTEKDVIRAQ